MRWTGWLWVAMLLALAALCAPRLLSGRAVETDLMAMLPPTEQNPAAEEAFRALARTTENRLVFLVHAPGPDASRAAALALARRLQGSGAFAEVQSTLPPIDPGQVGRFYAAHRQRMAAPELAPGEDDATLAQRIEARLATPGGFSGLPPALDPLGALGGFLARLPFQASAMEVRDDLLTVAGPDGLHVLVTAGLAGSSLDPRVQERALAAANAAEAGMAQEVPGSSVLRTGVAFFAIDARHTAERETNLISLLSILAILALYLAVFRSVRHLLLGLACVAAGMVLAVAGSLLLFQRLNLLTLVCGASVLGVTVDYSFIYFARHLGAGPAWQPRAALRQLLPALTLGLGTTALGYAALMAAPFPGMRQIAVFSILGLVGAFLTVLLVLPEALRRPMARNQGLDRAFSALFARLHAWSGRRTTWPLLAGLAVLLALPLVRLRVDDDVRNLIRPSQRLLADEARIQALTRLSSTGAFLLVQGRDEGQVLAREEALRARMAAAGLAPPLAISAFVPSPTAQDRTLASNRENWPRIKRAMLAMGFRPEAIPPGPVEAPGPALTVAAFLAQDFAIPFRAFWLGQRDSGSATIVLPTGGPGRAALQAAAAGLEGVSVVDKPWSVSTLLGRYRRLASAALAAAVCLVAGVLAARYGLRTGLRILLPALFGLLGALATTALLGLPVTLFTLMALILVLGFAVDYTVFLREGGADAHALLGVVLAAGATLISYGLLGLSHTPALAGFGLILSAGVGLSLATAFLALEPHR